MVYEEITSKFIEEVCKDFEFYDENGFLPFDRKRIDITLSIKAIKRLDNKNKSQIIENLILNHI